MTAGDKGTVITITVTGIDLTGSTPHLLVSRASTSESGTSYLMTVTSATTATYTTTGTEFPTGGVYYLKMNAQYLSGSSFSSPYYSQAVNY